MKKMTMDVDALRVESFATVDARGGRGTVVAHGIGCTVAPQGTCVRTCGNQPACTEDLCRDGAAITLNACCV
ncbi:MAG: hypothetical protein ACJ8GN_06905 [Longimicrobiaceae bacterium]